MSVSPNCEIATSAKISHPELVNLYGCSIEAETKVGPFVEIQAGVRIGARCKIQSHSFICEGVEIGNGVFIGHGVVFTNDRHPKAVLEDGLHARARVADVPAGDRTESARRSAHAGRARYA